MVMFTTALPAACIVSAINWAVVSVITDRSVYYDFDNVVYIRLNIIFVFVARRHVADVTYLQKTCAYGRRLDRFVASSLPNSVDDSSSDQR